MSRGSLRPANTSLPVRVQPRADERTRLPAIVTEFQPDAIELEEQRPPRATRLTLYAIIGLVAIATLWASLSQVDQIVAAPGRIITTAPGLVVQPLETSVIRTIDARVGDVVKAGARLATLDPTFAQADVVQLQTRLVRATAQVQRLEAELEGRDYVPGQAASEEERLQAQLYMQRHAYFTSQLSNFDERIAHARAGMATSEADLTVLSSELQTAREIETMYAGLAAKQVGSRLNLLQNRYNRLGVEQSISHMRGGLVQLNHELGQASAERQSFIDDFRRNALEDLVKARTERDQATEELNKANLRRKMVVLTVPTDAVVLEVAHRSIGSVVREAETLFTLVPLNVPLEVEVSVSARDIGHITAGRPARLKLDAFPFQKHGTASGVVRTVSEDVFAPDAKSGDPEHNSFYKARIRLTDTRLRAVPENFRLIPGMSVLAEIKVGRRSVISYFLYPLIRGLDESIREP
jgi:hemolysin D